MVLLGLPAHIPGNVRGRLAAHRHRVPAATRQQGDLAVDGQRHRYAGRHSLSGLLVARQFVRDLGCIDGYYWKPSWTFASLFGPTIKAVRTLSRNPVPILVSETGVAPAAGKPAKIADLFAGVRAYGLLGLVWFNASQRRDWRLNSPAAVAAFRGCQDVQQTYVMNYRPGLSVLDTGDSSSGNCANAPLLGGMAQCLRMRRSCSRPRIRM